MGMRARLQHDLTVTRVLLDIPRPTEASHTEVSAHAKRTIWWLNRRAHLLELVLSGRMKEGET